MKYHWYFFNYQAGSSRGQEIGHWTHKFTDRIEGPNFALSLSLLCKDVTTHLKSIGICDISDIKVSDIFYIGHFEEMIEVKK